MVTFGLFGYINSSSYEQQEDVNYESGRNDNELDNIEVDEPVVQRIHSVGIRIKHESVYESDPLESADYLKTTPRRKSPTKRQSVAQSVDGELKCSEKLKKIETVNKENVVYFLVASSSVQRQPRLIHTSKKKVMVETKGGRTGAKMKTIITTNEIKKAPVEVDNGGTRRSNRAKQQTIKKIETTSSPSPSRSLTNGTQRSAKSQAVISTNSKFQSNLLAELSKKSSNFSPDVVSDLEEILGSPIKTTRESHSNQVSRTQAKSEQLHGKGSGMVRIDYKASTDDESKPATRSSKRLSNRVQTNIDPVTKTTKTTGKPKKIASAAAVVFNAGLSSEESQESQDEAYDNLQITNNTPENIVLNIKQEKEVSYTMTDENSVFTCEMCSAVFSDRAQLLVHVPVHI